MSAFAELFCGAVGSGLCPDLCWILSLRVYALTSGDHFQVEITVPGHSLELTYALEIAFAHW